MNTIGPMTDAVINRCIFEMRKKERREKIMTYIIDPLLADLSSRYYPFFILIVVVLILIVVLLVAILVMTKLNG